MNKTIVIVIPVYNEAKENRLQNVIAAALRQTYPKIKVLIVDNNSTDDSVVIAKRFAQFDDRVRIVSESQQGLIFARQCGLEHVISDYFAQLDADCIPPNDWIENAMKFFEDPNVNAVSGPYYYYDAPWYMRWSTYVGQSLFFGVASWYLQKRKLGAVLIGGNAVIKTKALRYAGGYNMHLNFYAEDTDTGSRLAKIGKVVFSNRLTMPTSARRFQHLGFWHVIQRYKKAFLSVVSGKQLSTEDTAETSSPR